MLDVGAESILDRCGPKKTIFDTQPDVYRIGTDRSAKSPDAGTTNVTCEVEIRKYSHADGRRWQTYGMSYIQEKDRCRGASSLGFVQRFDIVFGGRCNTGDGNIRAVHGFLLATAPAGRKCLFLCWKRPISSRKGTMIVFHPLFAEQCLKSQDLRLPFVRRRRSFGQFHANGTGAVRTFPFFLHGL